MSNKELTREQIVDLLSYLGSSKIINRETKDDVMFTCTVHGESNPSAGFNLEKQVFNCFSCHARGGIEYLVMKSLPDEFKSFEDVDHFIYKRYGVDLAKADLDVAKGLRRYEDFEEEEHVFKKKILPRSFLAPFKSGKETYKYFFDRGFTKETLQDFMIGRDLDNKTITVPIYYDTEQELAGVIGRYIDPNRAKNQRYKIYNVDTGTLVFPQHKCKPIDGVLIVVEGLLDALYMHQLGYTNTFATLTNSISDMQVEWLKNQRASKLLDMTDNDKMGEIASSIIKQKVNKYMKVENIKYLYPQGCKDPQECTPEQVKEMLSKATEKKRKLKRIE